MLVLNMTEPLVHQSLTTIVRVLMKGQKNKDPHVANFHPIKLLAQVIFFEFLEKLKTVFKKMTWATV